jgi:hypothetical protein
VFKSKSKSMSMSMSIGSIKRRRIVLVILAICSALKFGQLSRLDLAQRERLAPDAPLLDGTPELLVDVDAANAQDKDDEPSVQALTVRLAPDAPLLDGTPELLVDVDATNAQDKDDEPSVQAVVTADVQVNRRDYIYSSGGAPPLVVEKHKLIFFYVPKVGCTVWLKLFRRMMGYSNWKDKEPHDPGNNGLVYLSRLNRTYATEIMNSPKWTKAIVLRDPKERFLSAYLDKAKHDNAKYVLTYCCKSWKEDCFDQVQTFSGFFDLTRTCKDPHWRPQSRRMEEKYVPLLNFIGHMETVEEDAQKLLTRLDVWSKYGESGWGKKGNESIFQTTSSVHHATSHGAADSWARLAQHYTPELEKAVEQMFDDDYNVPVFHLPRKAIFSESSLGNNTIRED